MASGAPDYYDLGKQDVLTQPPMVISQAPPVTIGATLAAVFVSGTFTNTTVTIYTCPAGKRAYIMRGVVAKPLGVLALKMYKFYILTSGAVQQPVANYITDGRLFNDYPDYQGDMALSGTATGDVLQAGEIIKGTSDMAETWTYRFVIYEEEL